MDALVLVVLGALVLALVAYGAVDAIGSLRARRHPVVVPTPPPRTAEGSGPARLVLVRHGQTEWSLAGRHTGLTDLPLTEVGRREAVAARELLAGWSFDAVLVSPLRRAVETLELLHRPEPVTVLDDLREWDYGEDEGLTRAQIQEDRAGWTVWSSAPRGGETIAAVAARVDLVLRATAAHEGDVLVVAHGHLLRVVAARWLGLDPAAGRLLALDPAAVSVLGHEREQRVLQQWNLSASAGAPPPEVR